MASNPSQLFLLADHIKLSLLERQRAIDLSLSTPSQDSQISRSLDSLSSGLDALQTQLEQSPNNTSLSNDIQILRKQYDDLQAQFSGEPAEGRKESISKPNDPSLASDFAAATSAKPKKGVRFRDDPSGAPTEPEDANRAGLFPSRYTDEPVVNTPEVANMDNQQVHAYHENVMRDQDEQLDRLGSSISRQRELSMQIGNELDEHVLMLDDVEEGVDRHQSSLDRAKSRLGKVAKKARENWSMTTIIVLIVILVLLIVLTK